MARRKHSLFTTTVDQSKSPLMSLPPELRNRIYGMVFENTVIVMLRRNKENPKGLLRRRPLLLTCKQAHAEAIGIYYSCLTLDASHPEETYRLAQFLRKIGQENVNLLARISLMLPYPAVNGLRAPLNVDNTISKAMDETMECLESAKEELKKRAPKVVLPATLLRVRLHLPSGTVWTHDPRGAVEEYVATLGEEYEEEKGRGDEEDERYTEAASRELQASSDCP